MGFEKSIRKKGSVIKFLILGLIFTVILYFVFWLCLKILIGMSYQFDLSFIINIFLWIDNIFDQIFIPLSIICGFGFSHNFTYYEPNLEYYQNKLDQSRANSPIVTCIQCGSTQITSIKRDQVEEKTNFRHKNEPSEIKIVCLKCGHTWTPGRH